MTVPLAPEPGRTAAPRRAYGAGAVAILPSLIEELGGKKILLVCGRTSFEASGAAEVLPALRRVAEVLRWSDFQPNTDSADLAVGLEIMEHDRPDVVLGIGGGSALDMAKLLVGYHDVAPGEVTVAVEAGHAASSRKSRLVLAPTTSGSGAEATHFAVVYVGDDKYSIAGPAMRPDALVLDPNLTWSGSPYQRATSGIDAVAQAIESFWATNATSRSRRFADHSLRLLLPSIEGFVTDPEDRTARAMMLGSHLAGRAIDISKTTAAHALSYGFTKRHGVSHGHAVALTLGAFIERHAEAGPSSLQSQVETQTHHRAVARILARLGALSPQEARRRFDDLLLRLGLETRMSVLGIDANRDLPHLATSVNVERLQNNPVALDKDGILAILSDSYR